MVTTSSEVCPICDGMGVVRVNVPVDHPDFGKLFPCICQMEKIKERKAKQLLELSNLDAYQNKTFATFEIDYRLLEDNEQYLKEWCPNAVSSHDMTDKHWSQIKSALEIAIKYAEKPLNWLLFWGSYGTGKTHLAAAIGNRQLQQGTPVLFMTAPDLLDHLKATFGPSSDVAYDELFERIRNSPLLILDDLGAEKQSDWAQEKLYQLLNYRHVRKLPTVITTNIALERIEPRIRSRLTDDTLTRSIRLQVSDRRGMPTPWQEMDLSNLDRYRDMTFEKFSLRQDEGLSENQWQRLERAREKVFNYSQKPLGWLVLMGEPGCGKTHLAASIAHVRRFHGEQPLFVTASELLDHLRTTFYPGSTISFDTRFVEIKGASMVIFDDLKIEKNLSAWARDKLFEILIYRFDLYLPTVITTAETLDEMDARLRSRVGNEAHSSVLAITVPSYPAKVVRRAASARMASRKTE